MKLGAKFEHRLSEIVFHDMEECEVCGEWHPSDYWEDCRNDDYRYHPEDLLCVLLNAPKLLETCKTMIETITREQIENKNIADYTEEFVKVIDQMHQAISNADPGY